MSGIRGEVADLTVQKPANSLAVFAGHFKLTGSLLIVHHVPMRSGHRLPESNVNLMFLAVFGVQERFSDCQQR